MPASLPDRFLLTSLLALLLLALLAWAAGRVQVARRARELVQALDDSTRGKVTVTRGPGGGGFQGRIEPAPDPYVHFFVTYHGPSGFDLAGHLLAAVSRRSDRLLLAARLPAHPAAELVWEEGQVPAHALARRARASLWVQRRLDIVDAEFAVRGANPGPLEHVFVDLQARFRPYLQRISVQGEEDPEVQVALRPGRMNLREVPALITSLRAMGKAAMRD